MNTRERVLEILESHKCSYYSGEKLALELGISRAAVWKAVKRLREDRYPIDAIPNKGYCLSQDIDPISERGIWKYLNSNCRNLDIHLLPEAGSTNKMLCEKANAGSPEGTVLIAGMQTDGKGRLGRHFYSPENTGIYMSLLLRPKGITPEKAIRLTSIAAVAGCEAVEAVTGKTAYIKWVNDIYLADRKICGILTEGSISMETGTMDSVVLGIGINVYHPENGFPKEIRGIAGCVFSEVQLDGKNRLTAEFLNRFMGYYLAGDFSAHIESYRKRSMVIGKTVSVIFQNGRRLAKVLDVDDECRLIVKYTDGTFDRLLTGEVSLKIEKDQNG